MLTRRGGPLDMIAMRACGQDSKLLLEEPKSNMISDSDRRIRDKIDS